MGNKKIIDEVHGTIVEVYEIPCKDEFGNILPSEIGITIEPDDKSKPEILTSFERDDYPQFSVGQRVVSVSYTWKRPATADDRVKYSHYGMECPNEVDAHEFVIYDELAYNQKMQLPRSR